MLNNYLKVAVRNLLKHRLYSLINISGLAVGMACCLVILLFVRHELSYDRFHAKAERIYRLLLDHEDGMSSPVGPAIVGPQLEVDFPEIRYARLLPRRRLQVCFGEKRLSEDMAFVDGDFLTLFTFPLIHGDGRTALEQPNSVVISQTAARKYFGAEDPTGQVLSVDFDGMRDYRVTGVMEDMPANAHFRFDFLVSFISLHNSHPEWMEWKDGTGFKAIHTYLLLPEGERDGYASRLADFARRRGYDIGAGPFTFSLQPLTDIHLHSHLISELEGNSDVAYVYIFATTAFFVLLVACINFTNLATARSAHRWREVGMRKVVGAHRGQLIGQFLSESVLQALAALVVGIALVEVALPAIGNIAGRELALDFRDTAVMLGLVGITLLAGGLAGSYPAFFLSRFRPAEVLKGTARLGSRGRLRKGLVLVQFAISILLLVVTGVVFEQQGYIRNRHLGFDEEQVVVVPVAHKVDPEKFETLKQAFLRQPGVLRGAYSTKVPGIEFTVLGMQIRPEGEEEAKGQGLPVLMTDTDFVATFGMEIVQGRDFSAEFGSDLAGAFILNETAVKAFDWKEPVGRELAFTGIELKGNVVGVVRDFHFESLHHKVGPVVILSRLPWVEYLSVRLQAEDVGATLARLQKTWERVNPETPFAYFFLDERFAQLHRAEERMGRIIGIFALIAVGVSCLGLLGLAAFTAEQRTKEIGIRKVLGASVAHIVLLLSKEFTYLVLAANLIAWPVAWVAMSRWLGGFAYRIELGPGMFIVGGVAALGIACLTVSYQAVRAALANPVQALKYE